MKLLEDLKDPSREFTPFPFWFLNGDLTHEELRRQLSDFCAHGVYGVVLHPRIGLSKRIGYLSDAFFSYLRTAVKTADRLGMRVILYDEGMYPSGSANGLVVKDHPELASRGLALVKKCLPSDEIVANTPRGTLVARPSGGTIRGIHWGEDDAEPGAPRSADILNPEAVARFLHVTHDAYYRALQPWFGKTILGFFTDEPSILGRNTKGMFPWTAGFTDLFLQAGGKPENLTALFYAEENDDTKLYRAAIQQRLETVYYAPLSNWCQAHGIALMGHPAESDDMELERWFQVPGQDLVYRSVCPEKGGLAGADATMAKGSADMARLLGRRRNSNECFGACNRDGNPWYLPGEDLKWYLDWLAVRGVNLFIPHAFYYSIAGKRRRERPPDVGPNSIWWEHYRLWSLYMRRLSCLMTDIDLHAQVAVLCENNNLVPAAVAPLFERQIGFQYLPSRFFSECTVQNGALLCRGRRYTAVLGDPQRFSQVAHTVDAVVPDCRCTPPQPLLRVAHFTRSERECWLLVNEGEEPIRCELELPGAAQVGQYDLWSGRALRFSGTLDLARRASLLLFACQPAEWLRLPKPPAATFLPCPAFRLVRSAPEKVRKYYEAHVSVTADQLTGEMIFLEIQAQEMAELSVNGQFAGVGFWPPQRFSVGPFLHEGENTFCLTVTGSLANLYGERPVPYGLL